MTIAQRLVNEIGSLDGLDRVARPLATRVARATRPTPVKNALSGTWLGHPLHPMLSDLPIGAWVMAELLDLTLGKSGARATRRLVAVGVLAAVPTAAAGLSDWSDTYGGDRRVGLVHALGNAVATLLQASSYVARRRGSRKGAMVLSAIAVGTVTGTGYLGGHLSFHRGVGVSHTAFEEEVIEWTDVAGLADLSEGEPLRAGAGDVPVVLVRRGADVFCLSATCVHAGGPLDEGKLVEGSLRCPWHGSIFRVKDGKVLRGPAPTDQPSWEVQIEKGRVQVRRRDR